MSASSAAHVLYLYPNPSIMSSNGINGTEAANGTNGVHSPNGANGATHSRPLKAGIYAPIPTFFQEGSEDVGMSMTLKKVTSP